MVTCLCYYNVPKGIITSGFNGTISAYKMNKNGTGFCHWFIS